MNIGQPEIFDEKDSESTFTFKLTSTFRNAWHILSQLDKKIDNLNLSDSGQGFVHTSIMPDINGVNTDHDKRYLRDSQLTAAINTAINGTAGYLSKFASAHALVNSLLSESSTSIYQTCNDPYFILFNNTAENGATGRDSYIRFRGKTLAGTEHTLAQIKGYHSGTAEDQKGRLWVSVNQGSDGDSPTAAITIDPTLAVKLFGTLEVSTIAALTDPATVYLTHTAGLIQSRTAAQVLSDIGAMTGSGTINQISKFVSATSVGDSAASDNGTDYKILDRQLVITRSASPSYIRLTNTNTNATTGIVINESDADSGYRCFFAKHGSGEASVGDFLDINNIGTIRVRVNNVDIAFFTSSLFSLQKNQATNSQFISGSGGAAVGLTFDVNDNAILYANGTVKTINDTIKILNIRNAADMDGTGSAILFRQRYYDASPADADMARIAAAAETDWTATASTRDSYLSLQTALDGTVAEALRLGSDKLASFVGKINVNDTTDATSTTDGSLQTDGGLSVAKRIVAGDDIAVLADSKNLELGAAGDMIAYYDGTNGNIDTDVVAPSDLTIDCGGSGATAKTVVLEVPVYDDIQVSISNIKVPTVNYPTERLYDGGTGGVTFPFLGFAVDNYIYFDVQTSHAMKLSTILENHIHYTLPNTTTIGDKFKFQLDVMAASINVAWAVPTGSPFSAEFAVAANDNTYHRVGSVANIPASNTTVSTIYKCKLTRIAASSNEYASEVYVTFEDSHYQKDTMGSRQQTAK